MEGLAWSILIFSFIAGITTLSMNLPQLIKVLKTRDTKSLSSATLIVSFINGMLWTLVGTMNLVYLLHNLAPDSEIYKKINPYAVGIPVLVANFILGMSALIMLIVKIKNKKNRKSRA